MGQFITVIVVDVEKTHVEQLPIRNSITKVTFGAVKAFRTFLCTPNFSVFLHLHIQGNGHPRSELLSDPRVDKSPSPALKGRNFSLSQTFSTLGLHPGGNSLGLVQRDELWCCPHWLWRGSSRGVSTWIPDVPSPGSTEHLGTGCESLLGSGEGQREPFPGQTCHGSPGTAGSCSGVSPSPGTNTGKVPPAQEEIPCDNKRRDLGAQDHFVGSFSVFPEQDGNGDPWRALGAHCTFLTPL